MPRILTALVVLAVACLLAVNVSAQEKKKEGKKARVSVEERFKAMDTNKDNILSEEEFVAGLKGRVDEAKAKQMFEKMGGTKEKGLTLEQYKKAREAREKGRGEGKKK